MVLSRRPRLASTASFVPGTVANGASGTATKTNAGTYAVTGNLVPNDTANYNTLKTQCTRELRYRQGDGDGGGHTVQHSRMRHGQSHTATVTSITGGNWRDRSRRSAPFNVSGTGHIIAANLQRHLKRSTGTADYNNIAATRSLISSMPSASPAALRRPEQAV